jgi:alkaline phosphatase
MKKAFIALLVLLVSLVGLSQAKYVFMFIGDGMSLTQIKSAELYLSDINNRDINLLMTQFKAAGMTTTYSSNSAITDSAAAGTALATGYKTLSGVINMDETKTKEYKTVAEVAKEKGMKVGIISSVSIDHATPAAYYAHQPSRSNYYEIGMELVESNFDFFGGGAVKKPDGAKGNFYEKAKENGYKVILTQDEFENYKPNGEKVIIFNEVRTGGNAFPYEIDRKDSLSLADITKKGIEALSKNNENGFFMMVEGGKIDWSGHANDAAANIKDTIAFDNAIKEAYNFYLSHPEETLIIVTGDHETGGMTIGFAGTGYSTYLGRIANQKMSYEAFDSLLSQCKSKNASFEDVQKKITENFGLTFLTEKEKAALKVKADNGDKDAYEKLAMSINDYEYKKLEQAYNMSWTPKVPKTEYSYLLYGGYEPLTVTLTHILNQKAGISWTSYSHTGVPVATFAEGVHSDLFNGFYDNTDIAKKLFEIIG